MTVGIRHDDLRRRNRAMVISAVRRSGQTSRTEVASTTSLSHSTISAIAASLINEGILAEGRQGSQTLKRGRPQVALTLEPRAAMVASIVLSLNYLSATIIDYAGETVCEEQQRLDTRAMPREELIEACISILRQRLADPRLGGCQVMRIALAIQGITDAPSRSMLWSPITHHTDIAFADILEKEFSIPVTVENDCNMMAVALRWRKPDRYRDDLIAILLSHGIGMGLVLKGALFTGTHSSGGEFGHMIHKPDGALCRCGRRGCIEAYAGNYAIWRNAHMLSEDDDPIDNISDADMLALASAARLKDGPEREAYRKAGEALGIGLGSLFALIDPAPVSMVGASAAAFDLIEPALRDAIAKTAGGHHSTSISFDIEADERSLIREGCAVRALTFIDHEIFAGGVQAQPEATSPQLHSSLIA